QVHLYDLQPAARERGLGTLRVSLARAVERGKLPRTEADAALARVHLAEGLDALADCDLVIAAVGEGLGAKRALFAQLDRTRAPRPFYLEALRLVGDGYADCAALDAAARGVGFRMGPFELMDLVGLDVNLAVSRSVFEQTAHEPRFRPHLLQESLVRAGQLGRKSG